MSEDKKAREERRRKIRELEASLFSDVPKSDAITVELPELKNVDEYSTKFGKAERQKRFQPPTVDDFFGKKAPTKITSKTTKITSKTVKKLNGKHEDRNHLLSDEEDDDDDDEETYDAMKSIQQVFFNIRLYQYSVLLRALKLFETWHLGIGELYLLHIKTVSGKEHYMCKLTCLLFFLYTEHNKYPLSEQK